jgi:hypothetical protein
MHSTDDAVYGSWIALLVRIISAIRVFCRVEKIRTEEIRPAYGYVHTVYSELSSLLISSA